VNGPQLTENFLQALTAGVLTGSLYGLMCVGLSVIFGVMRVINFAQGDFMMLGMYVAYYAFGWFTAQAVLGPEVAPYVAAVLAGPAVFLVGMGVFNGISTWISEIVSPRGLSITQAGDLGGALLLGGIIGAGIVPVLSDRLHKRRIFLQIGLILAIPGLIGMTFANSYILMIASIFVLGFFLMSLAPIGYQYAAEITFPAPEGTSNGLLNLVGQASVVFIYGMEVFKAADGSFTPSLLIMVVMMLVAAGLVTLLRESSMMAAEEPAEALAEEP